MDAARKREERQKPGPWPPRIIEPFVPISDHNPRDLESWAKRTGFNPNLSGETTTSATSATPAPAPRVGIEPAVGLKDEPTVVARPEINGLNDGNGNAGTVAATVSSGGGDEEEYLRKDVEKGESELDLSSLPEFQEPVPPSGFRPAGLRCGLTENPGFARLTFYGVQQYLSLSASLVFIPLIMVPIMGGTDEETATVISTMLLVSGVTTIMHSFLGTRLPLVQGSSFVYLAPALVIINSEDFRNLSENVPLSVAIVWAYAFFLTAGGAYNYKGCTSNIPSSNILLDACRRHAETMKHCRTDVSNAWRTAAWVRVPYPFQWGSPTFHLETSIVMIIVSIVALVDSIGSYHTTSLLINLRPLSPRIVSQGIGLEGFSSLLAGLWGTGTGSTTLTENVHTINTTKMASRRALELGAVFLILFSFIGKIGAVLASIPLALAASVLCFTWALTVMLGLSTLQYTQNGSSRNIIIVGFTLFISLSIPAYFQHYQPISGLILPSYLLPYAAASSGPVHSGNKGLDYTLNSILSLNMVVALIVAFVLENTVPGSRSERGGVYMVGFS